MNKVMLVGRLAADPEIVGEVARIRLAVDNWDSANQTKGADFIPCVAFKTNKTTLENYAKKGDRIGIEGRLSIKTKDQADGTKRTYTDVLVDRVELLSDKRKTEDDEFVAPTGW